MAARNKVSEQRARAKEPVGIVELWSAVLTELELELSEMERLLSRPSAIYDLFPRLVATLEVNLPAESASLYSAIDAASGSVDLELASSRKLHKQLLTQGRRLLLIRGKAAEQRSALWRGGFARFASTARAFFADERLRVLPSVTAGLEASVLTAIGESYLEALVEGEPKVASHPFRPQPAEAAHADA